MRQSADLEPVLNKDIICDCPGVPLAICTASIGSDISSLSLLINEDLVGDEEGNDNL